MNSIEILSENESVGVTHYILKQETNILSQKVISATHDHNSGTIRIRNGQHSIKTEAGNDPITAIEEALASDPY